MCGLDHRLEPTVVLHSIGQRIPDVANAIAFVELKVLGANVRGKARTQRASEQGTREQNNLETEKRAQSISHALKPYVGRDRDCHWAGEAIGLLLVVTYSARNAYLNQNKRRKEQLDT